MQTHRTSGHNISSIFEECLILYGAGGGGKIDRNMCIINISYYIFVYISKYLAKE